MRYCGFKPCIFDDSEILILGSFPSVKSREQSFYYANPRNRFWQTLAEVFAVCVPRTEDEKREFCRLHKIALWDIVTECEIKGSSDGAIRQYVTADIKSLITKAPIRKILLNGTTAAKIFTKQYPDFLGKTVLVLPSTSPANTRFDSSCWIRALN